MRTSRWMVWAIDAFGEVADMYNPVIRSDVRGRLEVMATAVHNDAFVNVAHGGSRSGC